MTAVNSANKAKAVNSNHETIVVENKITPQCNGLFVRILRLYKLIIIYIMIA